MRAVRPGDIVAGKFQVERVLGEGGMGYVVAARPLVPLVFSSPGTPQPLVALKFMRDDVVTDEYKARFFREARNTLRLKSRHVTRVLDVGATEAGTPYMVMEYLEGIDLSALLHTRGSFPAAEACECVLQACEAIAEAHALGIVHRDLKPANLFLSRDVDGRAIVKVLDFGVSKGAEQSEGMALDGIVTKATDLLGSPGYMAPEQIMSARDADPKSDVWSLGVILFRLVSGKAPFQAASLAEMIHCILYLPLPDLRAAAPNVPPGLEHVVARCLERDRAKRADATELARLLAPYAGPRFAPSLERIALLGPSLHARPSSPASPRADAPTPATRSEIPLRRDVGPLAPPARWGRRVLWLAVLVVTLGCLAAMAITVARKKRTPIAVDAGIGLPSPSSSAYLGASPSSR